MGGPLRIFVPDEVLLAAARQNNEELLTEVLESGDYDINHKDGYVLLQLFFRKEAELAGPLASETQVNTCPYP